MGSSPTPPEPPRILVIDDDEALVRLLELAFRGTRARVDSHTRGYGALQRLAELRPALVILDLTMPGLDGASVLELIREDPELRGTRVVLWSALPAARIAEVARQGGADGFLEKTTRPRELVERVRGWLQAWDGVAL